MLFYRPVVTPWCHGLSPSDRPMVSGYSNHGFGWLAGALAIAAGAQMVGKLIKLRNSNWAHSDAVAVDLTTSDFRDFCASIRKAEGLVACQAKMISASGHHKHVRVAA